MSIAIAYIVLLFILWILVPLIVGLVLLTVFRRRRRSKQVPPQSVCEVKPKRPLAQILKDQRLRCGMTQELVAEKLDVSRQAVSKWENGTSEPSTANLVALAQLYGIDPGDLLKNAQI